ncbi:MAG: hypothetical protein IPK63_16115 [Candidatus Competibacteraceae bacterium]|nr:hypothetical protein [Candidatus Competibacteraceae bacterium]
MKPEILAAAHWAYVESVLQLHDEDQGVIEKCGEHYKAAFVHGFKHGIESLAENSADKGSKIAVTRIYGARGADVFAEGMLSTQGDLIKIEGSRDMEITPDEAARLGKELIRLARIGGWIDPDESTDWSAA